MAAIVAAPEPEFIFDWRSWLAGLVEMEAVTEARRAAAPADRPLLAEDSDLPVIAAILQNTTDGQSDTETERSSD
jgi:hypothetical protein